jgi:DNA-binding beta-propeller fold protein YncE
VAVGLALGVWLGRDRGGVLAADPVAVPQATEAAPAGTAPSFQLDPAWPKPSANKWVIGQVSGISVDSQDHVWIVHIPSEIATNRRAIQAPPVIEFDSSGAVVQTWGGPGEGYVWPVRPHGITVDGQGNVWIGGDADYQDTHVLKFTRAGKFLLQIGVPGKWGGSNDKTALGNPAQVRVDVQANEVFVADGELNKRVIVFDATSGAYKRHWGAYGESPDDRTIRYNPNTPPMRQFGHRSVHCVRFSPEGLLFVCDRANNRFQVFQKDGTFVSETLIAPDTTTNDGSVVDLAFSPDRKYVYAADVRNEKVWILLKDGLKIIGSFGDSRSGGRVGPVHSLDVDSKGNIYTGPKLQKFTLNAR